MARRKQREQIVAAVRRTLAEIDQMHLDAEHWNRLHPDESPVDADPYGEMEPWRVAARQFLADEDARPLPQLPLMRRWTQRDAH